MEFRDNYLSLRNSLFGVFSQPSIEEGWQKHRAASRESREQEKRLRMPILCLRCSGWCHDAGLCPQTGASRPQAAGARQSHWRGHLPSSPGSKGEARPARLRLRLRLRPGADGRTPAAPALPAKAELGPAPGWRAAPIALPRPRTAEAPRRKERNGVGGQRAQLRCQRRRGGLRPSELLRREEGGGARRQPRDKMVPPSPGAEPPAPAPHAAASWAVQGHLPLLGTVSGLYSLSRHNPHAADIQGLRIHRRGQVGPGPRAATPRRPPLPATQWRRPGPARLSITTHAPPMPCSRENCGGGCRGGGGAEAAVKAGHFGPWRLKLRCSAKGRRSEKSSHWRQNSFSFCGERPESHGLNWLSSSAFSLKTASRSVEFSPCAARSS